MPSYVLYVCEAMGGFTTKHEHTLSGENGKIPKWITTEKNKDTLYKLLAGITMMGLFFLGFFFHVIG